MDIQQFLQDNDAYLDAREWAQDKSFQEIWETCTRVDWLIWLLKKLDFQPRTFQEIAVSLAESVTHLMRDERSKQAVVDLRRWLNGENVDLMMVRQSAAVAAADAAYVYAYAAYAAYAAVAVADAARYAADAADYAADAAAYDDIIRKHIPFNQVAQAALKLGIEL